MTITRYVTELNNRAKSCEFGELSESLIRDNIICGILDDSVRESPLRELELTLDKAVAICRASEVSKIQIKQLHPTEQY